MRGKERDTCFPRRVWQEDGILPLRRLPVVAETGRIVVADVGGVYDLAPHVSVANGVQGGPGNLGVVNAKTGADMVFVLHEREEMIVFEAYTKRDIVRYEILGPDRVGECARNGLAGGHTSVQLLYEIACQHVVVVQARRQEPVIACTILLSHLAIEKIDVFIERAKQDLNLRHYTGIGQQLTALCIRRLRVCQEYPSEVFASLLM